MLKILTVFTLCALHVAGWCQEVKLNTKAITCPGDSDGEIIAEILNAPYEYSIRLVHAANNKLISQEEYFSDTVITYPDLKALDYKVQIVCRGKLDEYLVSVKEPKILRAGRIKIIQSPSENECDGIIEIMPVGGVPPYTYVWSANADKSTNKRLESLCEGTYRCFVQDQSKCNDTEATVFLLTPEKN